MVTYVAKPKSGSQEVGTRSNPDLMEGGVFRGEGGNGLTLRTFVVFLFELLISSLLSGGMGLVSFFFFFLCFFAYCFFKRKMTHTP